MCERNISNHRTEKSSSNRRSTFDLSPDCDSELFFPDPIRSWLSQESNLAVRARNVCLTYGHGSKANYVLNHLSINVPVGCIYGLLGPSGCGKTSLLGIISGLIKPDRGLVKVFGYTPGTKESGVPDSGLGYMPQDVSLQSDMTVAETLWYFGRLFFLPQAVLSKRIDKLVQQLDIPDKNRLVAKLSGGQQRRVSLACAILHKPRLAILDEPTVGVDPLLCSGIWKLLNTLSQEDNMTIIITTHYIEECRKAGMVGFMRAGEILEEDRPAVLMEKFQANYLEDIFYQICFNQKRRNTVISLGHRAVLDGGSIKNKPGSAPNDSLRDYVQPYRSHRYIFKVHSFFSSIYTLTWRYFLQSIRNRLYLLLLFVFPVLSLAMMYVCTGHTPIDVPVAWVVDEKADYGGLHSKSGNFSEAYSTYTIPYYPEIIRGLIDPKILKIIPYDSLDSALTDVKKFKIKAAIYMADHFSASFHDRLDMFSQVDLDNETITRGTIWLYGDLSDQFMMTTIELSLEYVLSQVYNLTAPAFNVTYYHRQPPVTIGDPIDGWEKNIYVLDVSEHLTPGFIISTLFACAFAISSLSFISETMDKMFVRNYATGISPGQIVMAQILCRFMFLAISGITFLCISIYMFGIPCRSSPFLALVIIWLQALAGSSGGIVFAAAFPNFQSSLFVSLGAFIVVASISGLFWPIEALPYYIKTVSFVSPFSEAVISLRNIMTKENVEFFPSVFPGIATSLGWIIGHILLSIYILRKNMF